MTITLNNLQFKSYGKYSIEFKIDDEVYGIGFYVNKSPSQ